MDAKLELLGTTKDGRLVYVDMQNSHAASHFKDTPQLLELVKELLPKIETPQNYSRFDIDMGREIGLSDLVQTTDADDIVYAKRPNRTKYSRFVKNKGPVPSTMVTLELRKLEEGGLELFTAYIGSLTPPTPGDGVKKETSKRFWMQHALAWGSQEIDSKTETRKCPW